MLTAAVFSVILAAAAALWFPPVDVPTSCAAVLCQVGTVCRVEQNQNGDLQAQCVAPDVPKPGDCPSPDPFDMGFAKCTKANMCSQDSECDGDQKCCKNSCGGFTCRQPRPSCDTVKCDPGQKCEMQDVVCVREPCDPQPVCVDDDKAWECPAPEPSKVGICAFTCYSDSDCDGDRKCCKNGCGGTNCRSPPSQITTTPAPTTPAPTPAPTTPAPTRPTCATVKCGPGKTCVMKPPRDCDSDPCYPQPYCVDIEKPGECPRSKSSSGWWFCRSRCQSDADCLGDKKCCTAGCGKRCEDPVPETCATMKCEPGQKCEMQDVVCVRPPCHPQPVCVNDKPGECPKSNSMHGAYACLSECWSDNDCLGDKKCCMAGCGKFCKDPVETCASVDCLPDHTCVMKTECNKGGCSQKPVCEPVKRCPVYPKGINPKCVPHDLCSVKRPDPCPAGYLCCSTDCGRRCVRPSQ